MREMNYKITASHLQSIFDYFGIDVKIRSDARSLILTSTAGHGQFMTELMRAK